VQPRKQTDQFVKNKISHHFENTENASRKRARGRTRSDQVAISRV
jgi:hypothetical protein